MRWAVNIIYDSDRHQEQWNVTADCWADAVRKCRDHPHVAQYQPRRYFGWWYDMDAPQGSRTGTCQHAAT